MIKKNNNIRIQLKIVFIAVLLLALCFFVVNFNKFFGGIIKDLQNEEKFTMEANQFKFSNYYSYDAALSDFKKILVIKGNKDFIENILVNQKEFESISPAHHYEYQGHSIIRYSYYFDRLYHLWPLGFICSGGKRDVVNIWFDENENFVSFLLVSPCFSTSFKK